MFFIVTHSWKPEDEERVSREMIKLMYDCHYGLVGNPWPKLFTLWQDPRKCEILALWESSNRQMLQDVFKDRHGFETDIRHVRQLYPPHVGCYNLMNIVTKPDLEMH